MEYKVTRHYDETYLEECLSLWKFSSKEALSSVKTFSICCLVYLVFGLLDYLRGKSISLFLSSFGLACFILLIIQLLNVYRTKSKTKKNAQERVDKYKTSLTAINELLFTESVIKYCDPEILLEIKWTAISHYQEYRNYILFFLNETRKPVFSMDKNNISESIEKDLFALINSKIPRKN